MRIRCGLGGLLIFCAALTMVGCRSKSTPIYVPWDLATAKTGPNGGHLMELGTLDFFAELVHKKQAGTVTVYLLDDKARLPAWGDHDEAELDITVRGEHRQIPLKIVKPDDHTRYVSTDRELVDAFDHETISHAILRISAGSKDYEVDFDHSPHGE